MKFETHLDRCIFKTIEGCTAINPQTLMGILAGVDAHEKLILSREELSDGLHRLINAGLILEVESRQFCKAADGNSPSMYSDISEAEHAQAVQEYHEWFQRKLAELDDDSVEDTFPWRKLVLRWKTPEQRWPTTEHGSWKN